jgi:two-component system response regulator RstA
MSKRILLVEDDLKLASVVSEYLRAKGFEVLHEADGAQAPARITAEAPDLIILDVLLPGLDGWDICRRVRPDFAGPILMLTALGDEVDEVVGLELGADDYLVKPVRPRVLLARVQALLRRTAPTVAKSAPPAAGLCVALPTGELRINSASREANLHGDALQLTTAEFDLLLYLAQRAGHVVRRDDICRELRGYEWDGLDRAIDIRVARLRRKLGDDGKSAEVIKSVRGEGYLMALRT